MQYSFDDITKAMYDASTQYSVQTYKK